MYITNQILKLLYVNTCIPKFGPSLSTTCYSIIFIRITDAMGNQVLLSNEVAKMYLILEQKCYLWPSHIRMKKTWALHRSREKQNNYIEWHCEQYWKWPKKRS